MATGIVCGVDLVDLKQFRLSLELGGSSFLERHFTPAELAECRGTATRLAVRFAAKEAVGKALGIGVPGATSREVEVMSGPTGAPRLCLRGRAAACAAEQRVSSWSLSLSHTSTAAIAMVVGLVGDGGAASAPEAPPPA